MLTINQLNLKLDDTVVLDNLSLTAVPSETLCIIGPSGAGKSSVLRCIAGFEQYHGSITLNDEILDVLSPQQRNLGYVEQDNTLFPQLSAAENIGYPLLIRRLPAHKRQTAVADIMEQLHITKIAHQQPHQLSGGEQRRVMLARTLIYQPQILLFDEPFAGVDALLRFELVALLKTILAARAVPTLYVTHDLAEAEYLSTVAAVLRDGKIVAQGSWSDLKKHPDSWVRTFLQKRF